MKREQYRITVMTRIFNILGETNPKRERLCQKCFNKRMSVDNAVSYIILNS